MPLLNIIHWVLGGGDFTPPEAAKEYSGQQRCLIDAMGAGLKGQGLALPKGDITKSEQRSAKDQKGIWSRKFAFTGAEFDRISDAARAKCPALGTDVRWNPKNKDHEKCWKQLTDDEKQQEILSASSAPGVSRHHAGVDFDFGQTEKDLDPKAWTMRIDGSRGTRRPTGSSSHSTRRVDKEWATCPSAGTGPTTQ
jgi:hypothetical protein